MSTRTLTATLPPDTLYVSGTVNGAATTWTNTQGKMWETVAERSANDIYVVALTIINSVGAVTETTFTLYYGLHLVTDRTQADVTARNQKGTYNASDLNRVGAAMIYVADKLDPRRKYDTSVGIDACCKDLNKGFDFVVSQQKAFYGEEFVSGK